MSLTESTLLDQQDISRRSVIRKAAYTAPVVFAIAAAPKVALGKSGNNGNGGGSKNNNGKGNGDESGPAPGNSGDNGSPNSGDKNDNNGR